MSEITKPIVFNETVQALNSKIDTTNGYLQRIAAGVAPNLVTKSITDNGTYAASFDEADGYSSVTVDVPSIVNDVVFYDYDGTVLHTYKKDQFLALTEMPSNPTHTGLTAQGWNWSLADAKEYVTKYRSLHIGQMYVTSDGKTRIHIHMVEGRLNPKLTIQLNGTCVIDWGDESSTDTITGSNTEASSIHTYSTDGDYIITLDVTGTFSFVGDMHTKKLLDHASYTGFQVYQTCIKYIYIGNNVTSISDFAFYHCFSLASVTIPESVTSIGSRAFSMCDSLTHITIPEGVTSIGNECFYATCSLASVAIPKSVNSIGTSAFELNPLTSVNIPESVTSIGPNAFCNCKSLASVTIPEGVTSIESSAFYSCYALSSVNISESVTSIGSSAFYYCYALSSVNIPESVTSIGQNAFDHCYALSSVAIPEGVTSISDGVFGMCFSLASVTIPESVTSIGQGAFWKCQRLAYIKFKRATPPTVANSSAFSDIPQDCIIYVPAGSLTAYKAATNYPNPSTYTYVEY